MEIIAKLPQELREHIIYLGGLELAAIFKNKYILNLLIKNNKYDFEKIFIDSPGYVISTLLKERFIPNDILQELKNTPPGLTFEILDSAIYSGDMYKLVTVVEYFPKFTCSVKAYNFTVINNLDAIREWIDFFRPNTFSHLRVDKQRIGAMFRYFIILE